MSSDRADALLAEFYRAHDKWTYAYEKWKALCKEQREIVPRYEHLFLPADELDALMSRNLEIVVTRSEVLREAEAARNQTLQSLKRYRVAQFNARLANDSG